MKNKVLTHVFVSSKASQEVARLGERGFSTKFIAEFTGMTESQVMYRLARADLKRADYRNGKSAAARQAMHEAMSKELQERIDKLNLQVQKLRRDNRN